jgi:hypothetical protein
MYALATMTYIRGVILLDNRSGNDDQCKPTSAPRVIHLERACRQMLITVLSYIPTHPIRDICENAEMSSVQLWNLKRPN